MQQLTETLLAMEEEKAIWFAKEKVSIEAIEEKSILHNAEIDLLSKEISEVTLKFMPTIIVGGFFECF